MSRKIIIALLALLLLAGGAWFFITFRKQPAAPAATTDNQPINAEPDQLLADPRPVDTMSSAPELIVMSKEPVADFWINQFDGQVYFITPDGSINQASPTGATSITASRFTQGVSRVLPSPRGDAVIIVGGNQSEFKIYDVERRLWRALPAGTTAAAWSPVAPNNEVVFLQSTSTTGNNTALNIFTVDRGSVRAVTTLNQYDLDIAWLTASTVMLFDQPSRAVRGNLWSFDVRTKTLIPVLTKKLGLWLHWLAGGAVATDGEQGSYLLSSTGTVEAPLPFVTTPDKCTREGFDLYCAVPRQALRLQQLPDAYLRKEVITSDQLMHLSLVHLPQLPTPTRLAEQELAAATVDIWRLQKQGDAFYFIDRHSQQLYRLLGAVK